MTEPFDPRRHPHRRFNTLTGQWVLVSPLRTARPWRGGVEPSVDAPRPRHDPECYLCPGNARAGGARNPDYAHTFAFTNDFATLREDSSRDEWQSASLLRARGVTGTCRVMCYSPRHDLTLAEMDAQQIARVIELWCAEAATLARTFPWVQIFENKGETMGASMPHPHGQVWAVTELPGEAMREDERQRAHLEEHGSLLLLDYAALEEERQERVVCAGDCWLAVVPYWALWPFEVLLLPRRHVLNLSDLDTREREDLARTLRRLLVRYDNLFETSFPYSMGWHQAPADGDSRDHWQLHAHFYPPLLRSASVRKFMVGYELLAEGQRDLTAEDAAARLRDLSDTHYRLGRGEASR